MPDHRPYAYGALRCLDGPQIEHEAAGIFALEPECWHIGMTNHEPFAQSVEERIEIHPAIERAERRRPGMRALTTLADGVTLRAQCFSENLAMPLQCTRLVLLGETNRYSEQQKQPRKPCDHSTVPWWVAKNPSRIVAAGRENQAGKAAASRKRPPVDQATDLLVLDLRHEGNNVTALLAPKG